MLFFMALTVLGEIHKILPTSLYDFPFLIKTIAANLFEINIFSLTLNKLSKSSAISFFEPAFSMLFKNLSQTSDCHLVNFFESLPVFLFSIFLFILYIIPNFYFCIIFCILYYIFHKYNILSRVIV